MGYQFAVRPLSRSKTLEPNFRPSPRSGTALHAQIFLILREGIVSGRYPSDKALPSEGALTKAFKVSRATVRRALGDLEAAGFVERRHGLGTFVRHRVSAPALTLPMRMASGEIDRWGETDVTVVEFGYVRPTDAIAATLRLRPDELTQRAVRVRSRRGNPLMHLTTHLPEVIGRTFAPEDMKRYSLRQLLEKAGRGYQKGIQTIGATLADPVVASLLQVRIGAPLLHIRRLLSDAEDRPVEYLELKAAPDAYELRMTFQADEARPEGIGLAEYRSTLDEASVDPSRWGDRRSPEGRQRNRSGE